MIINNNNSTKEIPLWGLYHQNSRSCKNIINKPQLSESALADLAFKKSRYNFLSRQFKLSRSRCKIDLSFDKIISQRRSNRVFADKALSFAKLSGLLRLSCGVSGSILINKNGKRQKYNLRTVPSAGALFSANIYPAVLNVTVINTGIYHYNPDKDCLELLRLSKNMKNIINNCIIAGENFKNYAAALIITAEFDKLVYKYGERGYRYALLDAGHIGENIYLAAAALGLSAVGVCGFYDDEINRLVFADWEQESALYILLVGNRIAKKGS